MTTTTIPAHDQATHDLARALAPALADVDGNPWQYEPPTEDRDWTATAYVGCGNQRLAIKVGGFRNEGRVSIHGDYPRDPATRADVAHSYRIPRDVPDDPKMTATTTKTAARIAQEIARKILPDYRHRLAATLHILAENDRYAARRDTLAEQVAEWSNGTLHPADDGRGDRDRTLYPGSRECAIEVGGTLVSFVRLTIDTSTPEGRARAERVARALAE